MSAAQFSLESIRVASPCAASWDAMAGSERVRFCAACSLHVYNLSAMTREDAIELIKQTEGRLCVRLYRRKDGTVLTHDCPVGLRAARRWIASFVTLAAMIVLLGFGWGVAQSAGGNRTNVGTSSLRSVEPFRTILNWIDPQPQCTMGVPAPLVTEPGGPNEGQPTEDRPQDDPPVQDK